jgi:hypothetical protein
MSYCTCPEDWREWSDWLAAGLHGRCRWRLPVLMVGLLFGHGRRTVTSWLRAASVTIGFQNWYYFIASLGRKTNEIAQRLLLLVLLRAHSGQRVVAAIDDSPTKRYGPKVQGAGVHHNPTPGPTDQKFLYGHIWVTFAVVLRHVCWGTIALPLLSRLYVRKKDVSKVPRKYGWQFRTKLELAAEMVEKFAGWLAQAGKKLWVVADGFYAKRPFLQRAKAAGVVVISRLRKDAALRDLPAALKQGQRRGRGRPRKYGRNKMSLAKRAGQKRGWQTLECVQYGQTVVKTFKTFLATYRPADGIIRVVIVQEALGCQYFFCTDPDVEVWEILEIFADRTAIEQDFHDLKEVWGAGQQQVRNIWANIGAWHLCMWMHTLVELWAWNQPHEQICDRSRCPWDNAERRPSHADCRKALQRQCLERQFSTLTADEPIPPKTQKFIQDVLNLAV